jgi:hypothetical protein
VKLSELDTVDGATIHPEDAIDTIISHMAKGRITDLEPVDIYSGPSSIQESLELRLQTLISFSPPTPEAQEETAEIRNLIETATQIRRDFAIAIAHSTRGEQTGLLRIHRVSDPTFPDDIHADKLITDSLYLWTLDSLGLDIKEWAPVGYSQGDSERTASFIASGHSKQETKLTETEIAKRVLADLIRQFMRLALPNWAPGQPPEQRPTNRFLSAGNLSAHTIAKEIVKEAIKSTAGDDSDLLRRQIGLIRGLIEGREGPKPQTKRALRGYYRSIYWTAAVIDARLRKKGETTANETDTTHAVFQHFAVLLSFDRQYKIVDDDILRGVLEKAYHKRLPDP